MAQVIHGITIPFDDPPACVVSLVPPLTLTLFELKLAGGLAGVSDQCPPEAAHLPRVGAPHSPDLERIQALRPELVLADEDHTSPEAVESLAASGIRVWQFAPRTLRDAIALMWALMHALDNPAMVPRVRLIDRAIDYMELSAGNTPPIPTFAALHCDPWVTCNRHTYTHDLLKLSGAQNVFAERSERYFTLTTEEILAAQPQVILLPQGAPRATELSDTPAAQARRIHFIPKTRLAWYGTESARAQDDLPHLIQFAVTDEESASSSFG